MTTGNQTPVSRNQVEAFLTTCIETMSGDDTRNVLKDPSSGRPGAKLVEIQKQVWDDLGVSTDAGRLAVRNIKEAFPDDHAALLSLRDKYAITIDATYLQCLEDRRPNTLKKKGKMPRNTVLEFLDACNVKLDVPEVRDSLRRCIKETGLMPDSVVNDVHNEVMELLGFEKSHGQRCFRELGTSNEFMKDREVAMCYARWRGKTSEVCLALLNEFQKEGGELKVDQDVRNKLLEIQAKEELDSMSAQERAELIEKNVNKVNIFHKLPLDGRQRYLDRLSQEDKLELVKSEVLISTVLQAQQQKQANRE